MTTAAVMCLVLNETQMHVLYQASGFINLRLSWSLSGITIRKEQERKTHLTLQAYFHFNEQALRAEQAAEPFIFSDNTRNQREIHSEGKHSN